MSEREVQKEIMDYLLEHPDITAVWQNDSNRIKGRKFGAGKYRPKGLPDICLMFRGGRFGCVEVKYANGKPSPEQVQFLAHIKANFGYATLAYSLDEVKAWLKGVLG